VHVLRSLAFHIFEEYGVATLSDPEVVGFYFKLSNLSIGM
jgi:hypothetical protein